MPRIVLAAALLALGLVILATAVTVYAIFTASATVTPNDFASDTLDPATALGATGGSSIDLNWTATADTYASGHRVLRSTTSGGPYTQIAEVTPRTTTNFCDAPAAGTYFYVLRAFYQSWESANSNEASATTSGSGCATTGSFVSVADSYADQANAGLNFGTDVSMFVRSWKSGPNSKNMRSFARFDVSTIPAGATINSATLTLCATSVAASRTYDVHRVTATWAETSITWSSQPATAATATASATTPASAGCMTWTVTADVQAWVDGTANNGWRIKDSVEDSGNKQETTFRTREDSLVAERPTLDVNYTPP